MALKELLDLPDPQVVVEVKEYLQGVPQGKY
jgi:hypothetical protein